LTQSVPVRRSLPFAIRLARKITGTAWSGPLFANRHPYFDRLPARSVSKFAGLTAGGTRIRTLGPPPRTMRVFATPAQFSSYPPVDKTLFLWDRDAGPGAPDNKAIPQWPAYTAADRATMRIHVDGCPFGVEVRRAISRAWILGPRA
jgi:hypothetical protein